MVHAEQAVISDVMYTHAADTTMDSHYKVKPQAGSPSDWTKPVDYSQGSVHVLLEVKTKPAGDTPTKFQICFEGTPDYACTDQSPTYTKSGKYEWDSRFADFWYGGDVDWSKGVTQIALILKDTNNGKPQGDPKYVPSDLHVQVTLVSPGATFMPTASAGSGGGAAAVGGSGGQGGGGRSGAGSGGSGSGRGGSAAVSGRGSAAGSGGSAGAARDAGTEPDAAVDAGAAAAPSAGSAGRSTGSAGVAPASGSGTGAAGTTETSVSPATGAGSAAETPASGGKDDSGCSTTGRSGPVSGALILLALVLLRRRKQRALG